MSNITVDALLKHLILTETKVHNAVDELAQDAVKELEKELKKAMKKWKF